MAAPVYGSSQGKAVVILEDNDAPGRAFARKRRESCRGRRFRQNPGPHPGMDNLEGSTGTFPTCWPCTQGRKRNSS